MKIYLHFVFSLFIFFFSYTNGYAAGDVTITTVATPAGDINQGTSNNIIYIAKVDVAGANTTITSIAANLSGSFGNDDLTTVSVYYNLTAPGLGGASNGGNVVGNFAAPHLFTIPAGRVVAAGSTIYILLVVNTSNTATDNHTININGAADPLIISTSTAPNIINNQSNAAMVQTIQAADITFTTVPLAAANVNQGTGNNIVYIAKVDVATEPVTITSIAANLSGSFDNDDLTTISVYYNLTTPSLAGASTGGNVVGGFAAPHLFTIPTGRVVAAGSTIYILLVVNTSNTATDNHTININGAADPLTIGTSTAPNIINSQSNAAGVQTIQAADMTFTTVPLAAANVNQGTGNNIVYIAKVDVATEPVTITSIAANLSGSFDNDDLTTISVYYNLTTPSLAGASTGGNVVGGFAAPHLFTVPTGRVVAAGSTIYILLVVNTGNTATDNHTINVNGATDPLTIATSTAPNIINNQTNAAGVQTIQAADITSSTVVIPAGSLNPGTGNNIVYITKIEVGTEPITVTSIQANLSGSFDNDDLTSVSIFYNPNAPNLAGASSGGNIPGNFSAPHLFTLPAGRVIPAGSTMYVLVVVTLSSSATDNHTITINGATDPLVINTTTAPNFTTNQTNTAGVQTIQASDVILSTVALTSGNIIPGSGNNIVYILKVDVGTSPVTTTNLQFTLGGNYDNDDLGNLSVSFNSNPTLTGASSFASAPVNADGPHSFSISAGRLLAAGTVSYFIFTVGVNAAATENHTVAINGASNPVLFTYTTVPNVNNSQSNAAGSFNISSVALPLTLESFTAQKLNNYQNQLEWVTATEINTKSFDVQWSTNGTAYAAVGTVAAQGNSTVHKNYSFIHDATASGISFYRLRMIDIDGQFTYSPVVSVNNSRGAAKITIAPNPASSQLRIIPNDNQTIKTVRILDVNGRVVWHSAAAMPGITTISLNSLGKGMYTAVVSTTSGVEYIPFIKVGQ